MVTTIQLNEGLKQELLRIKSEKETYEDVIIGLIRLADKVKRNEENLLIEGCKEMAETNKKITKNFEQMENLGEWEW